MKFVKLENPNEQIVFLESSDVLGHSIGKLDEIKALLPADQYCIGILLIPHQLSLSFFTSFIHDYVMSLMAENSKVVYYTEAPNP